MVHSLSTRRPKQVKKVPLQMDTCCRCGGKHNSASCEYKDSECHFCGRKGHLLKVCKSKARVQQQKPPTQRETKSTHQLTNESQSDMLENTEYSMFHSTCGDTKPYIVSMHVGGVDLTMEVNCFIHHQ